MKTKQLISGVAKAAVFSLMLTVLSGCPQTNIEYEAGFIDGFMRDDEYWLGYADSYETVPDGPILYSGSEIPFIDDESYDAGYWDGVWYAYNDGYFVSYDYAFTIGFSEGYDLAFRPGWRAFLANDVHPEYLDGSFADGYNDGFSEGSIFGASDYRTGLPFDWLDAMWDYREGTDLYIEEVGRGTGEWGLVYLYEYGVDPRDYLAKSSEAQAPRQVRRPRITLTTKSVGTKDETQTYDPDVISYRELTDKVRQDLSTTPEYSARSNDQALTLTDSWLDRVNIYRNSLGK